jgi:hypothetical protein
MIDESQLELALKNSWSKETSLDPENWTPENPALGQCAVTSVIVNDYLGGEIVWANVILPDGRQVSHYFNKINGIEKDFTKTQFPEGTVIPNGIPKTKGYSSTREYILSYPKTQQRYELLKQKVKEFLR